MAVLHLALRLLAVATRSQWLSFPFSNVSYYVWAAQLPQRYRMMNNEIFQISNFNYGYFDAGLGFAIGLLHFLYLDGGLGS